MNNPIITADRFGRGPVPGRASAYRVVKDGGLLKIAPVIVLVLALMMPPEVRVDFAGQNFYSYRLAWLTVFPWALFKLLRGEFNWRVHDLLLVAGSGWIVFSLVMIYGIERGLPSGLGVALDLIVPYFIARVSISNFQDLRRALVMLAPVFFVFAVLLPLEAYLQNRFIRDTAAALFGGLGASEYGMGSAFVIATDTRYGLLRAMGPFSHPILAGIFFASLLPLYYWSGIKGWPRLLGLSAGCFAVFTLSSAAYLALVMFGIMAAYDFVRRRVIFLSWPLFTVSAASLALILHIISENGLISVLIRFTLTPQTGYYRLLIWEFGTASVERNPLFGIGYEQFDALAWMGDSIDAHWLNLAVRHGLPPAILLIALSFAVIWACARMASRVPEPDSSMLIGLAVTLVIFVIVAFSVAYFGGMLIWFVMILGIASSVCAQRSKGSELRPRLVRVPPR